MNIHSAGIFILVFCTGGQAQLEENGKVIWYSDDDEDFRSTVSDEFLSDKDQDRVLEYLVEEGFLEEDEATDCEIEVESLESNGEGNDDEDGDEELPEELDS